MLEISGQPYEFGFLTQVFEMWIVGRERLVESSDVQANIGDSIVCLLEIDAPTPV